MKNRLMKMFSSLKVKLLLHSKFNILHSTFFYDLIINNLVA